MTHQGLSSRSDKEEAWLPAWADPEWFGGGRADRRFDEFLNLPSNLRAVVARWVEAEIRPQRERALKRTDRGRFDFAVGAIVANAIVAMGSQPSRVHYSRDEATYRGDTPYAPPELRSGTLVRTITDMEEAGLLWSTRGQRGQAVSTRARSTYRPRRRLLEALARMEVTPTTALRDDDAAPVVLLRDENGRNIPYDRRAVEAESTTLRAYNTFVLRQQIGLNASMRVEYDASKLRLHRIYNRDLSRGGRFYGGWYQSQRKSVRSEILINSRQTVELDYVSFLPRALYHEAGIDYREDPYEAPEVRKAFEAAGHSWPDIRNIPKRIFIVLVNAISAKGIHSTKPMRQLSGVMRPKDAIEAIRRHNSPIADRFLTGYGTQLMKKDSDICAEILGAGLQAGIPVLPIHDSFVVEVGNAEWLKAQMFRSYRKMFGFNPVVK